jgi:hypothetical protein
MTNNITRRNLIGFCTVSTVFALLAATATAQPTSTTQKIKGTATSTTRQEHGTVTYVEGNNLVIKMSTGEVRVLTVPDSRTAFVDGKEITVHDLKVGTTLTANITTTTTPVIDRTVSNLTGTVWHVQGNNVILTLADGTNKMYKAKPDFKFNVNGQQATVFDLRKGMKVSAEKIVEEPRTEIASDSRVSGTGPKPVVVAAAPAPAPAPARAPVREPAAAPAPAPEPAQVAETRARAQELPAKLPKTGSPLPLAGMFGLMFTCAGLGLRMLRRS